MKIVLASESPRRKHLLSMMGLEFKVVSHKVNESDFKLEDPKELVGQLAMAKALSVAGELVIGSDLTVCLKNKIMGKPKDKEQAREFLKLLSGKIHTVYCGVAVTDQQKTLMSVAESEVEMKNYDEKIIDEYIRQFEVLDKGGGYAIQFELPGYGSLVKSFKGGITTIIGLPLDYLENLLKEFGVKSKADWRRKCNASLTK
ncbi:MAG: nucleoside triphosphate pyrophosphatase [Patescibacteria group bacterium]|nr:nucleoside triphosphate pyrophosphatase [Patescibacteria group bacterium]